MLVKMTFFQIYSKKPFLHGWIFNQINIWLFKFFLKLWKGVSNNCSFQFSWYHGFFFRPIRIIFKSKQKFFKDFRYFWVFYTLGPKWSPVKLTLILKRRKWLSPGLLWFRKIFFDELIRGGTGAHRQGGLSVVCIRYEIFIFQISKSNIMNVW